MTLFGATAGIGLKASLELYSSSRTETSNVTPSPEFRTNRDLFNHAQPKSFGKSVRRRTPMAVLIRQAVDALIANGRRRRMSPVASAVKRVGEIALHLRCCLCSQVVSRRKSRCRLQINPPSTLLSNRKRTLVRCTRTGRHVRSSDGRPAAVLASALTYTLPSRRRDGYSRLARSQDLSQIIKRWNSRRAYTVSVTVSIRSRTWQMEAG